MRPSLRQRVRHPLLTQTTPCLHLQAWAHRIPLLRATLQGAAEGQPTKVASHDDLRTALREIIEPRDRSEVWLALSLLTGRLPDRTTVIELARAGEFDKGDSLWRAVAHLTTDESASWKVRVAIDEVLIDVAHTAAHNLSTGIQRVARETTRRWLRDNTCTPVSWTRDFQSLRELTGVERSRIVTNKAVDDRETLLDASVVIPWNGTYLLPELAAEPARCARLLALAELTPNRTGVIGFDCVPMTSAETVQLGFAGVFAGNLAAVRSFDVIATISQAAGAEYSGWRSMLAATGLEGPRIEPVQLPVQMAEPGTEDLRAARARFLVGNLPLVLVVGSHEPRKNHLAVLHAAELLWREGVEFSLSFVGGNAWGSDSFSRRLVDLQRSGRPVDSASRLPDGQLWAAYRLARCTVFPSFNEGFGLPVAESLAAGTPAITSNFGSLLEIAADGGALTVDPHDDHAIADAMRTLLVQEVVHDRLRAEAANRPARTWDDYAREVWDVLAAPRSSPTTGN